MLVRPWLVYYRRRFLTAAIFSLLAACLAHMWVSRNGLFDFGIFWHSFCRCPVEATDAYFLLNFPPYIALFVGLIFGFPSPGVIISPDLSPVPGDRTKALSRFFLTRPVSRSQTFLLPQALAMIAIAILPAIAFALLIGWLRLVHAPSLHHLMATIRVIPEASGLGQHPTFVQVLTSLRATRRYFAAISVGFSVYAILSSQHWLMLSPNKKLNLLGVFSVFIVLFAPTWGLINGHTHTLLFLAPGGGTPLTYMPSILGIVLHFGIAFAISSGCWRILRGVEL